MVTSQLFAYTTDLIGRGLWFGAIVIYSFCEYEYFVLTSFYTVLTEVHFCPASYNRGVSQMQGCQICPQIGPDNVTNLELLKIRSNVIFGVLMKVQYLLFDVNVALLWHKLDITA